MRIDKIYSIHNKEAYPMYQLSDNHNRNLETRHY